MTENFVFRKEWREALRGYSAEVRAEVYEAVMAYAFDNEIIEIEIVDNPKPMELIPGAGEISIGSIFGDMMPKKKKKRRRKKVKTISP